VPSTPPDQPPTPRPEPAPPAAAGTQATGGGRWTRLRAQLDEGRQTRAWRVARWPALALLGLVALGLLTIGVIYATVELPDELPPVESAIVYDANGEELAAFQQDGLRVEVTRAEVAPVVIDALIAAEDRRFYDHGGIDPVGLGRAIVNNVRGRDTQGGSTITQQLVKNTYLSHERSVTRKVREAVLAFKLERRDDKDHILERYLNTVYFGRGAYGIEAAARIYFDSTAKDLDTAQAALLIGLLRAPETADPVTQPEEAATRRATVLQAMVATDAITSEEAEAAERAPMDVTPSQRPTTLTAGVAPHFVEWVRHEAIARFGEDVVYSGGLRITTTLDLTDQRAAEMAVAAALDDPDDPQVAMVGLDRSGAVRAYVGGRDFGALQVDLARGAAGGGSGRQPGSTFKPFVLAAALEDDIPLGSRYPAPASTTLDVPGEPWEVANYGNEGFGEADLISATARSINTVYAQLALDVGPEAVVDVASRAGITTEMAAHPSIALGTPEVSPLDMASAYLTFARDGERVEPFAIARVETTSGEVLFEQGEPETERAMDEGVARAVNHALQAVVSDGTGRAAHIGRPVAGKTGTTQGNGDAWFAGYTPEYAAVVWMGHPEGPERPLTDVDGRAVTGGGLPAQIWQVFMSAALDDLEPTDFAAPPRSLLRGEVSSELVVETTAAPAPPPEDDGGADEGDDETTTTSTTSSTSTTTSTTSTTTTTTSTTTRPPQAEGDSAGTTTDGDAASADDP
jgi:penicillin-binding protein 1A